MGPRSLLDWPKTELRLLILGPALLQILVLASGSIGAELILRMLGARALSADGRLALEKVHIILMIAASLSTFGVGLALALAIRRQLLRVRDAALAAPLPSFERNLQPRISVVLTPRFTDRTIGPPAVRLKVVARRGGDS